MTCDRQGENLRTLEDNGAMNLRLSGKRKTLILLLVALGAAVLLSSTLSGLQLGSGDPFPGASGQTSGPAEVVPSRALPAAESVPIFRGLLAIGGLVVLVYILVRLVTLTNIKALIGAGLALVAIVVLLLSLPRIPTGEAVPMAAEELAGEAPSFEYATSPLGKPPPAFTWIAAIGALAGAAMVVFTVLHHSRRPASMAGQIGHEAQMAVQAIRSGEDSTNAIVRYYLQMTKLIAKERHLERDHNMTVREFEAALEAVALPPGPLRKLQIGRAHV